MEIVAFALDPEIKSRIEDDAKRCQSTRSAILREIVYGHYARSGSANPEGGEKIAPESSARVFNPFPTVGPTPPQGSAPSHTQEAEDSAQSPA